MSEIVRVCVCVCVCNYSTRCNKSIIVHDVINHERGVLVIRVIIQYVLWFLISSNLAYKELYSVYVTLHGDSSLWTMHLNFFCCTVFCLVSSVSHGQLSSGNTWAAQFQLPFWMGEMNTPIWPLSTSVRNSQQGRCLFLIYLMGDKADEILWFFHLTDDDPKEKFNSYFIKWHNAIFEQAQFKICKQEPGKPVDAFIN